MQQLVVLILLNLVVLNFSTAPSPSAAPLFNKPFVVIWNAPIDRCNKLKIKLDLSVFQAITTPQQVPDQVLTLMYSHRLGLFPYINLYNFTQYNGGVPQNGNLNDSLKKAETEFTKYIPKSAPGLAVLDWEEWFPLFDRNADLREIYKEVSINSTIQKNPSLKLKKAKVIAKQQFEKAARGFFEETLKLGTSKRPNVLWGYYLFPDCYNYDFLNPNYTGECPKSASILNNKLEWLWKTSTAFFPSAYMPVSLSESQKAALFVRHKVLEAMRLAQLSQHPYTAPVYLYLQLLLRDQTSLYKHETDLVRTIGESAALGAAGCVLWGASCYFNDEVSCRSLSTYLSSKLNKYVVNVTTAAELCSNLLCQGKGRCVRKASDSNDYLHLNIKNFKIQVLNKMYKVSGKPSTADLTAWANTFTCKSYEGKSNASNH